MAERNEDVPEQKRLVYRIGVTLGDVLVRMTGMLGDAVKVARYFLERA